MASRSGSSELISFFKEYSSPEYQEKVNTTQDEASSGDSLPLLLARKGNLTKLKDVVTEKGKDFVVKSRGKGQDTILHIATISGHLEVVQYLVEQCGCDVTALGQHEQTPLHNAAHEGHDNVVVYLANLAPSNVHSRDQNGRIPLHCVLLVLPSILQCECERQ